MRNRYVQKLLAVSPPHPVPTVWSNESGWYGVLQVRQEWLTGFVGIATGKKTLENQVQIKG